MRLLLVLTLLAFLAPATVYAASRSPGDGTLSIRNGHGVVNVAARGAIIGRFDRGQLTVLQPRAGDCDALQVWGADRERPFTDDNGVDVRCVFSGSNVRFRFVGERHVVRLRDARDIDLSVVGRGAVYLRGTGVQDGQYSVNGESYESLPDEGFAFLLAAPSVTP